MPNSSNLEDIPMESLPQTELDTTFTYVDLPKTLLPMLKEYSTSYCKIHSKLLDLLNKNKEYGQQKSRQEYPKDILNFISSNFPNDLELANNYADKTLILRIETNKSKMNDLKKEKEQIFPTLFAKISKVMLDTNCKIAEIFVKQIFDTECRDTLTKWSLVRLKHDEKNKERAEKKKLLKQEMEVEGQVSFQDYLSLKKKLSALESKLANLQIDHPKNGKRIVKNGNSQSPTAKQGKEITKEKKKKRHKRNN